MTDEQTEQTTEEAEAREFIRAFFAGELDHLTGGEIAAQYGHLENTIRDLLGWNGAPE